MQPETPQAPLPACRSFSNGIPWYSQFLLDEYNKEVQRNEQALGRLEEAERIVSDLVQQTPDSDAYYEECVEILATLAALNQKFRSRIPSPLEFISP